MVWAVRGYMPKSLEFKTSSIAHEIRIKPI